MRICWTDTHPKVSGKIIGQWLVVSGKENTGRRLQGEG